MILMKLHLFNCRLLIIRCTNIELTQENDILLRLQNIESCYTSIYRRYANGIEEMEMLKSDMEVIKRVVMEHSEKLQKIG